MSWSLPSFPWTFGLCQKHKRHFDMHWPILAWRFACVSKGVLTNKPRKGNHKPCHSQAKPLETTNKWCRLWAVGWRRAQRQVRGHRATGVCSGSQCSISEPSPDSSEQLLQTHSAATGLASPHSVLQAAFKQAASEVHEFRDALSKPRVSRMYRHDGDFNTDPLELDVILPGQGAWCQTSRRSHTAENIPYPFLKDSPLFIIVSWSHTGGCCFCFFFFTSGGGKCSGTAHWMVGQKRLPRSPQAATHQWVSFFHT